MSTIDEEGTENAEIRKEKQHFRQRERATKIKMMHAHSCLAKEP